MSARSALTRTNVVTAGPPPSVRDTTNSASAETSMGLPSAAVRRQSVRLEKMDGKKEDETTVIVDPVSGIAGQVPVGEPG